MEEYFTNLDFPKGISRNLSYLLGAQVIAKLPFNGSSLWLPPDGQKFKSNGTYIKVYVGNMVVPPEGPNMIIFSRKTHGCWGSPPF